MLVASQLAIPARALIPQKSVSVRPASVQLYRTMKTTAPLSRSHQRTFDRIFQHPISHNLEWRDVHALLEEMCEVEKEHNGSLKVTRNGQTLVLHPTSKKDVTEMDEVIKLRHFLERSETFSPDLIEKVTHWLLVIDHHEARIFHSEMEGALPQRILPYGPNSHFRHAPDSKATARGQEKPDPNTFFEPVAKILQAAGPILIFGTGTGTSSEMEQFCGWLKNHYPETSKKIIGSVVVDEHHLTEGQLLTKAQDFYAKVTATTAGPVPAL
jgi:hypothetical protein